MKWVDHLLEMQSETLFHRDPSIEDNCCSESILVGLQSNKKKKRN